MFKIWVSDINKIVDPLVYSDIRMEGELKRTTLRCNDGHRYYRNNSNKRKTKLYFRCYKHKSGCIAKAYTKYGDKDDDRLQVIHTSEGHNHSI